jgi:hypothetical protein
MTGLHGYAGPQPAPGHFALSKRQLESFVHDVKGAIGTTGDAGRKLGFTIGPLCFDMPDDETRQFIRDAFAVARENDAVLAQHGSPNWISGDGANVSPSGMPGEANMETYLGRMFNHGAVMVNIFSWGIGGPARRDNFFRKATENPDALAAYAKFLRGGTMVETASTGFSAALLQEKMHRIQNEFPAWIRKSGQQAKAAPFMQKLSTLMKDKKWRELDQVADQVLSMMSQGEKP